jgi:hypothetical protein
MHPPRGEPELVGAEFAVGSGSRHVARILQMMDRFERGPAAVRADSSSARRDGERDDEQTNWGEF